MHSSIKNILTTGTLLLAVVTASAQVRLTDITVYSADAAGNYTGPDLWETRPGGNYNIWIQNGFLGEPFLNGPTDANVRPNILLSPGLNTFTLVAEPGATYPRFGINLYFNGATLAGISALAPVRTADGPTPFEAGCGLSTPVPDTSTGLLVPGACTLSFVSGDQIVTLRDFYWANPDVYNANMVGPFTTTGNGTIDFVGGISIELTPVPEPQALLWAFAAIAGGFVIRSARRKRH